VTSLGSQEFSNKNKNLQQKTTLPTLPLGQKSFPFSSLILRLNSVKFTNLTSIYSKHSTLGTTEVGVYHCP